MSGSVPPVQIHNSAALWAMFPTLASEIHWDTDASSGNAMLQPATIVSGRQRPRYRVNGGKIIVNGNPGLPAVTYSLCDQNFISCNFVQFDALLFAADKPGAVADPTTAAVQLEFERPIGAVGLYLGVVTGPANNGALVTSRIFVLLDGETNWTVFQQSGHCGAPLGAGMPAAPFLGAWSPGAKIKQLAFDANSPAPFGQICLSNLLWAP